ncbi:hypothetical protein FB451DRAFT_1444471 [Mycena latifolia]|nr:hypothetical protein FB451DRAFT_1444471 [Mycena latifolia]
MDPDEANPPTGSDISNTPGGLRGERGAASATEDKNDKWAPAFSAPPAWEDKAPAHHEDSVSGGPAESFNFFRLFPFSVYQYSSPRLFLGPFVATTTGEDGGPPEVVFAIPSFMAFYGCEKESERSTAHATSAFLSPLAPPGRDEGEGERGHGDGHDREYDYRVGRESAANATSSSSSPRNSLDARVPYSPPSLAGSLGAVVLHSSPMDGLAAEEHPDPASTSASMSEGTSTDREEDTIAFPNETQITTFVMYVPKTLSMSNDPTAIRPEDVRILEEHVPEGGNKISGHNSIQAENWVEQHYDTALLHSIRSLGLGGPLATMLSPDTPALTIFGSILDDHVLELAKTLSDVSGFAVMVRPTEDDPLTIFILERNEMDIDIDIETGYSTEGSDDGIEQETQESVNSDADDSDTDSGEDYETGGAFRPRGGALRTDAITNQVDPDYIVPAGIDRPDGSHRARVKLHLQLHENCEYNVAISSKTTFKFQTEKAEIPHVLEEPITRPQLLSCVDLKVETRPFQVLVDRSYSNLGFIVHRPNSIAGREYLPRGFDPPSATATYGIQKSTENAGSLVFGLDSMQPTVTAKLSYRRNNGETVQLEDDKPAPPCHVQEQIGEEWDMADKSYSSYDVAWHPLPMKNGNPRPVNIRFGMGIEFFGKEERYITRLPTISHILRNQIILWVFDPELKAKVRGMIVLTSTYIPDIKIAEPLTIAEDEVVDLSINGANDPPTTHNTPLSHDAANSVAIGIFEQRPEAAQSGMRKLMHRIIPKSSSRKRKQPMLIDLPLHEYVARGWDATNEQWRNTVWPTLDERFSDAGLSSSAACWNLALHPGPTEDGMNCERAPEASDNPAPAVPQIVQTMLVDPPTEKDFGRPGATTLPGGGYSDTESGSSASESNAGDVVDVLMHGVEEKTRV